VTAKEKETGRIACDSLRLEEVAHIKMNSSSFCGLFWKKYDCLLRSVQPGHSPATDMKSSKSNLTDAGGFFLNSDMASRMSEPWQIPVTRNVDADIAKWNHSIAIHETEPSFRLHHPAIQAKVCHFTVSHFYLHLDSSIVEPGGAFRRSSFLIPWHLLFTLLRRSSAEPSGFH